MSARDRYRLCDDTCTTDCGACKGAGAPDRAAGGDQGDNTALCPAPLCPGFDGAFCDTCPRRTLPLTDVPAADRQTDEEQPFDIAAACEPVDVPRNVVARYRLVPIPAARPAVADAVMADLGAAITEGVTEARLREAVRDGLFDALNTTNPLHYDDAADEMADAVLALREMRALLDAAAAVQRVEAYAARQPPRRPRRRRRPGHPRRAGWWGMTAVDRFFRLLMRLHCPEPIYYWFLDRLTDNNGWRPLFYGERHR